MTAGDGLQLGAMTHPGASAEFNGTEIHFGRYGAVVAYAKDEGKGGMEEGQTPGKSSAFSRIFPIAFLYNFLASFISLGLGEKGDCAKQNRWQKCQKGDL